MAALRAVLALLVLAVLCAVEAKYPTKSTVANKFKVTWNVIPGGMFGMGFYDMPRTATDAKNDGYAQEIDRTQIDNTTVWCRQKDFQVCVLFDLKGSVAGLQVSHSVNEIQSMLAQGSMDRDPHWFRQYFLGKTVYSTIAYFVDDDTLKQGGRTMDEATLTAPNGIRILENRSDFWLSTMDVPLAQDKAADLGFGEQHCFHGMGKHYFLGLTKSTNCEYMRSYFTLYGKDTETLHGYGVLAFGKLDKANSAKRNWFEQPAAMAVKIIAPNHPQCLIDWVNNYTLNTIHVFFIDSPWNTSCDGLFGI